MPTSLPNGYSNPNAGESGNIFCPIIETNFERLADHEHDGSDGNLIPSKNLVKPSASILAASWVADGVRWKQSITMPTGYVFDSVGLRFVDSSSLEICLPEVKKTGASTFEVYTNDNSLSYTVLYI